MKNYLTLIALLICLSAKGQSKDTLISKRDLQTVIRNQALIQQHLHSLHIDGILRDKLDSVYFVNLGILTRRDTVKTKGKKP